MREAHRSAKSKSLPRASRGDPYLTEVLYPNPAEQEPTY